MVVLSGTSFGDEDTDANAEESPVFTTPMETVDNTHTSLSEMIETTARRIDQFFGNDRAFQESNETSLQISLDYISEEDNVAQFESRVRGKLVLPGTERRLRLIVESDPEELDPEAPGRNPIDALETTNNYIIGVEGERLRGDWQLRPSLGVKPGMSPQLYGRFRAIRYFDLDKWVARFQGTAAWFSADGKSLSATTDFDRRINDKLLFRSSTGLRWNIDDEVTDASQVFTLYQRMASKAKLAYDIGVVGNDDTHWRVTDQFVRLRYRRLVYKNWAFMEIQPMVSWPEDNDFHEELSLLVRLELNFGSHYR
jgi:hypothetical protein